MNIEDMTLDQLNTLLGQVSGLIQQRQQEAALDKEQQRQQIAAALGALTALIGPVDAVRPDGPPVNIREALTFDTNEMAGSAGLGLQLAFTGMLQLAQITLAVATVVSQDQR